ncbi:hypothetical protein ACH4CE_23715 [Streptomyces gelaticus]|uniref:hypothetical protein n=1 Tax=Streptomyces gelaticus TaxID=285446 RepID=UPI0037B0E01D
MATSLLFTGVRWFTGPLATTRIGRQGPGRAATITTSAALYAILPRPAGRARSEGGPLHF